MEMVSKEWIINPEISEGAIINDHDTGFRDDYLVLHCLLRIYNPKTFFEIGTHMGLGTLIIKNSIPDSTVYSLDLADGEKSKQYPGEEHIGEKCKLEYVQLLGDSLTFDFSQYPCEGYYIDGEHDYEHVKRETDEILKLNPKIVVYHDSDMPEVMKGILDGLELAKNTESYEIYRIVETRVSFILKGDL